MLKMSKPFFLRHPMALSESELMLSALLEGAKLSGMAWHSIQSFAQTGSAPSLDKLDHLDYQIVQCYSRKTGLECNW
ncbi:unnamed protein product, partial [Clonostachys chloroleuca]